MAEKVFEHFLELPRNARTEVIDEMEPDDSVRLTRCSKLCSEEVQASKNYIHRLFVYCREEYMRIIVLAKKVGLRYHGFHLTFARRNDRRIKTYGSLDNETLWEVEFDSSTDMIQYAIEELKYRLKIYQGSIKGMIIKDHASMLTNVDLGFKNLGNLETLEVRAIDISQILSKLQKPLKELHVYGTNNTSLTSNHEQIYQVQNKIDWPDANFDIEQLQRLAAKNVNTSIGQLTEKDIFKFIRSWQNGTIGKEIESYQWWYDSSLKKKKLLRLLRIQNRKGRNIEIKHYNEVGKRAILAVNRSSLHFGTVLSDFDSDISDFSDSDF